jgi:polysaccharide biosynthesis protein PslA
MVRAKGSSSGMTDFINRDDLMTPERRKSGSRLGKRGPRLRATVVAALVDLLALICAAVLGAFARFGVVSNGMLFDFLPFLIIIYYSTSIFGGSYSTEAFFEKKKFITKSIYSMIFGFLLILMIFFSLKIGIYFSRIFLLLTMLFSFFTIGLFRLLAWPSVKRLLGQNDYAELVIADGVSMAIPEGATVLDARERGLRPDISDIDCVNLLSEIGSNFDRIIVHCSEADRKAWTAMLKCLAVRGEIRLPQLDDIRPLGVVSHDGQFSAVVSEHPLEWHQAAAKRAFDIVFTLALMPLLLPVIVITALAIKLDSRGPVFFKQRRIGLGHRQFSILKFRSMRSDMQDDKAARLAERGDSRITRVGRFIRATSIDELPQFFNVLSGDMSIVGPRPHAQMALAGDKLYWEVNNEYWHRHVTKPGITGLAQVRGFRGNTFEEGDLQKRLDADLEYISNWSLLRDIEILFSTLLVLTHDRAF